MVNLGIAWLIYIFPGFPLSPFRNFLRSVDVHMFQLTLSYRGQVIVESPLTHSHFHTSSLQTYDEIHEY